MKRWEWTAWKQKEKWERNTKDKMENILLKTLVKLLLELRYDDFSSALLNLHKQYSYNID